MMEFLGILLYFYTEIPRMKNIADGISRVMFFYFRNFRGLLSVIAEILGRILTTDGISGGV